MATQRIDMRDIRKKWNWNLDAKIVDVGDPPHTGDYDVCQLRLGGAPLVVAFNVAEGLDSRPREKNWN